MLDIIQQDSYPIDPYQIRNLMRLLEWLGFVVEKTERGFSADGRECVINISWDKFSPWIFHPQDWLLQDAEECVGERFGNAIMAAVVWGHQNFVITEAPDSQRLLELANVLLTDDRYDALCRHRWWLSKNTILTLNCKEPFGHEAFDYAVADLAGSWAWKAELTRHCETIIANKSEVWRGNPPAYNLRQHALGAIDELSRALPYLVRLAGGTVLELKP